MTKLRRLSPADADQLREQPFTYPDVGRTAEDYPSGFPDGYRLVRHQETVGRGRDDFESAARTLMTWRMHRDAGLTVTTSSDRVEVGSVVRMRLGVGPLAVKIPCRVIYVVDEPDRRGFGYGTLPGHPESGEESFLVSIDPAGTVTATITAFSRPGTLLTRLARPVTWWVQGWALRRYAQAVRAGASTRDP